MLWRQLVRLIQRNEQLTIGTALEGVNQTAFFFIIRDDAYRRILLREFVVKHRNLYPLIGCVADQGMRTGKPE